MARLRKDFQQFTDRGVTILAIGPNSPTAFEQFWKNENIPFTGLPDPEHKVAKLYRQEVNLFKAGRMPLNLIVDQSGSIRFVNYGSSMSDIPSNEKLFEVIDLLNTTSA